MKRQKGFTLAELLLCLLIIGLVSAFGATIAKKSAQNAYNKYWKAGYENLYIGIATVLADNSNLLDRATLNRELSHIFDRESDTEFTTKNGIKYNIVNSNDQGGYIISMTVPQPKTRANRTGMARTDFLLNTRGDGYLIPLEQHDVDNYVNLQQRSDLLPFYADDSMVGKTRIDDNTGEAQYRSIEYHNYREVACSIFGNLKVYLPNEYRNFINSGGANHASAWSSEFSQGWDWDGDPSANEVYNADIVNCDGVPSRTQRQRTIKIYKR